MTERGPNFFVDIARRGRVITTEIEKAIERARAMLALEQAGTPEGFWR